MPMMHLVEKTVEGDKVHRKWDDAQTPYQRLLATTVLSSQQQARLQAVYEQTNPLLLREEMYAGLATLWEAALAPTEWPLKHRKERSQAEKSRASWASALSGSSTDLAAQCVDGGQH
jgi:hypothetical protein